MRRFTLLKRITIILFITILINFVKEKNMKRVSDFEDYPIGMKKMATVHG
jgi:hypothetical protein